MRFGYLAVSYGWQPLGSVTMPRSRASKRTGQRQIFLKGSGDIAV
jgi:hypothetical protein